MLALLEAIGCLAACIMGTFIISGIIRVIIVRDTNSNGDPKVNEMATKRTGRESLIQQPANINDKRAYGLRDWLAKRVDGSRHRWVVQLDNPLKLENNNRVLVIRKPEGEGEDTKIEVSNVKSVIFRPLSRFDGHADLMLRIADDMQPREVYEGTFLGGSVQIKQAVDVLKKANLLGERKKI